MRVLITGHTGFKGAWLSMLLSARGHDVTGIALDPEPNALFDTAHLASRLHADIRLDIRRADELADAIRTAAPEVVLHLGAQALVRESYRDPRTTFETNAIGTLNVLDAMSRTEGIRAAVIVTTDKVYRNVGRLEGYREDDPLGGDDPYSASKAMADLLTQSWVTSFPGVPTAIARAGNVIGGGDVSKDRLLVDLVAGFREARTVPIRYPDAVRPWQHVLDCLSGYLTLAAALLEGRGAGAWNFGPDPESFQSVRGIADAAAARWGEGAVWADAPGDHPHEATLLTLDPSKAQQGLGWRNRLTYPDSLEWTIDWYRDVDRHGDAERTTLAQIDRFTDLDAGSAWQESF